MKTLQTLFADFATYVRRPRYVLPMADAPLSQPLTVGRQFLEEFPLILPIILLSAGLTWAMCQLTGKAFDNPFSRFPSSYLALMALLAAVVLVEAIFRNILRLTENTLKMMIAIVMLVILTQTFQHIKAVTNDFAMIWLVPSWILTSWLLGRLLTKPAVLTRLEQFWQHRFTWVFYGIAVLYSLRHLGRLTNLTDWQLLMAPVVMLISLLISTYLGYVRMKYGFWYAVAANTLIVGATAWVNVIAFA
jgi:hypothetical protein